MNQEELKNVKQELKNVLEKVSGGRDLIELLINGEEFDGNFFIQCYKESYKINADELIIYSEILSSSQNFDSNEQNLRKKALAELEFYNNVDSHVEDFINNKIDTKTLQVEIKSNVSIINQELSKLGEGNYAKPQEQSRPSRNEQRNRRNNQLPPIDEREEMEGIDGVDMDDELLRQQQLEMQKYEEANRIKNEEGQRKNRGRGGEDSDKQNKDEERRKRRERKEREKKEKEERERREKHNKEKNERERDNQKKLEDERKEREKREKKEREKNKYEVSDEEDDVIEEEIDRNQKQREKDRENRKKQMKKEEKKRKKDKEERERNRRERQREKNNLLRDSGVETKNRRNRDKRSNRYEDGRRHPSPELTKSQEIPRSDVMSDYKNLAQELNYKKGETNSELKTLNQFKTKEKTLKYELDRLKKQNKDKSVKKKEIEMDIEEAENEEMMIDNELEILRKELDDTELELENEEKQHRNRKYNTDDEIKQYKRKISEKETQINKYKVAYEELKAKWNEDINRPIELPKYGNNYTNGRRYSELTRGNNSSQYFAQENNINYASRYLSKIDNFGPYHNSTSNQQSGFVVQSNIKPVSKSFSVRQIPQNTYNSGWKTKSRMVEPFGSQSFIKKSEPANLNVSNYKTSRDLNRSEIVRSGNFGPSYNLNSGYSSRYMNNSHFN